MDFAETVRKQLSTPLSIFTLILEVNEISFLQKTKRGDLLDYLLVCDFLYVTDKTVVLPIYKQVTTGWAFFEWITCYCGNKNVNVGTILLDCIK